MTVSVQTRNIGISIGRPAARTIVVSKPVTEQIRTGQQGPRGPAGEPGEQGPPGPSAAGVFPAIRFSFGDATPAPILAIPAGPGVEIILVSLQIEIPFDGIGAAIELGTTASPGLLMAADQNYPIAAGTYDVQPRVEMVAGEIIVLRITPGAGATTGRGQVVVQTASL